MVSSTIGRFVIIGARAFSDLFGKFLVPMILGKNCVFLGKKIRQFWEKILPFYSKIGKVNLLDWDFSANWECSRSIGNFSANWEIIWCRKPDPVLYRERALGAVTQENQSLGFPTRSDTNLPVQSQKMAGSLKFRV